MPFMTSFKNKSRLLFIHFWITETDQVKLTEVAFRRAKPEHIYSFSFPSFLSCCSFRKIMTACLQRPAWAATAAGQAPLPAGRAAWGQGWLAAHVQMSKSCWRPALLWGPGGASSPPTPPPANPLLALLTCLFYCWYTFLFWYTLLFGVKGAVGTKCRNSFKRACTAPSMWLLCILEKQWQSWKSGCPAPATKPWVVKENGRWWVITVRITLVFTLTIQNT